MMTDGNRRTTQPMGNLTQVHNNPAELISTLGISNGDSLTIRERAEPAAAAAPAAPPSHDALLSGIPSSIAAAGNAEEDDDAQLAAAIAASLVDSASTQLQLEQQQKQQRLQQQQQQQQKASVPSGPAPTPAGAPTALLPRHLAAAACSPSTAEVDGHYAVLYCVVLCCAVLCVVLHAQEAAAISPTLPLWPQQDMAQHPQAYRCLMGVLLYDASSPVTIVAFLTLSVTSWSTTHTLLHGCGV
jgi:type II secretory pathway pseudopilin PulG